MSSEWDDCRLQGVYLIKAADINESIRDQQVRVIGDDGEQLGIMTSKEAYHLALEKKLDLVKIAPNAKPPVCKIMDYGKYRYEQQKRDKEARKKQKSAALKEVRLGLNIEKNDLQTKAKNASKFLLNGDKVKVSLRFKGREMGYTQLGYEVIKKFAAEIEEAGEIESPAKLEGRSLVAVFAPKK
ncbi:translation initiation factor IF-3 [Fusibacter sp. JL298sf-3]